MTQTNQNRIPVIVHPGYPKTASTTLQKHYFPKIGGLDYVGKYERDVRKWKYGLDEPVRLLLMGDEDQIADRGAELRQGLVSAYSSKPFLISEERILGSIITPRVDTYGLIRRTNAQSAARAIRRLFPENHFDVRILISIRAQHGIIPSKYAQSFTRTYSHIPKLSTFDRFVEDILECEDSFMRRGLDYWKTVQTFEEVFGKDRILVFPFELIQFDLSAVFDEFMRFCSLNPDDAPPVADGSAAPRERVRSSPGGKYRYHKPKTVRVLSRAKRRYFPNYNKDAHAIKRVAGQLRSPFASDPGAIQMTPEREDGIRHLHTESNRQLSHRNNLDLGTCGYF